MSDIINKFLLAGDKVILITYSACGSYTKSKKECKSLNKL